MATPRHNLGAHDREPFALRGLHQVLEMRRELRRLHVVGIAPK